MNRKKWTQDEDNILREMYEFHDTKEIAQKLDRSVSKIYNRTFKLGLKKDKEIVRNQARTKLLEVGAKTRFKKGMKPINKGKKQAEYMTPEAIERTKATRFKSGQLPHNYRPVGSERITIDNYVEIKVKDPRTWKLKHRVIWEKENGKIPKGYNVQFRNGNSLDLRLENLYLISKQEQVIENGIHRYPPEMIKIMRLKKKLEKTIKEKAQ